MKLIEVIIKPYKLEDVRVALQECGYAGGLTISEVRGFGRQQGHVEMSRGGEYQVDFIPKLKIEILCESRQARRICETVKNAARTGKIGDGKIFVIEAEHAVRIRTGEIGASAV